MAIVGDATPLEEAQAKEGRLRRVHRAERIIASALEATYEEVSPLEVAERVVAEMDMMSNPFAKNAA